MSSSLNLRQSKNPMEILKIARWNFILFLVCFMWLRFWLFISSDYSLEMQRNTYIHICLDLGDKWKLAYGAHEYMNVCWCCCFCFCFSESTSPQHLFLGEPSLAFLRSTYFYFCFIFFYFKQNSNQRDMHLWFALTVNTYASVVRLDTATTQHNNNKNLQTHKKRKNKQTNKPSYW